MPHNVAGIKVEIVLPNYNSELYLEETIHSVIKQTFKNWKLTIIDGNSNIETQKILNRYNQLIDTLENHTIYIFSDFQKINNQKINIETQSLIKIGLLNTKKNLNNVSIDSCYFKKPIRTKNKISSNPLTILLYKLIFESISLSIFSYP